MAVVECTETSGELPALNAALDAVGNQFLPSMDITELGARCITLQTARQRLDGIIAIGIAEAERAGVAANAGTRTMAQYIAARTHASPDALRADQRVGSWAGQFKQLETAMLDGRLSRQHVDLLRRTENIRVFMAMQRDQAMLMKFVADLEWKSFQYAIKYWLLVNDQDGVSNFVRTSLLALGAKTLTRFHPLLVYAQCGRLRREGNAARVVTGFTSADVDRQCRRVEDQPPLR